MDDLVAKPFDRRAQTFGISDQELCEAADDLRAGNFDAALGQGLYKQRIRRSGTGKSRSFRAVISLRHDKTAIFMTVFAKKDKANLSKRELQALRKGSAAIRKLTQAELAVAVGDGSFREIECEAKEGGDDVNDDTG